MFFLLPLTCVNFQQELKDVFKGKKKKYKYITYNLVLLS